MIEVDPIDCFWKRHVNILFLFIFKNYCIMYGYPHRKLYPYMCIIVNMYSLSELRPYCVKVQQIASIYSSSEYIAPPNRDRGYTFFSMTSIISLKSTTNNQGSFLFSSMLSISSYKSIIFSLFRRVYIVVKNYYLSCG